MKVPVRLYHKARRPVVLSGLLLAAACQTVPPPVDFSAFGRAAAGIGKQADLSFAESNRIARAVGAERFVQSGSVGLVETAFPVAIPADQIAVWQTAFRELETYGNTLAALTDSRSAAVGDQLVKLGRELNGGKVGAAISPGLGGGFASLGGALIQSAGVRQAKMILNKTNPSVQTITAAMADAIGSDDGVGLRGTVKANWTASANDIRGRYATAAQSKDAAKQRAIVAEYLALLDKRDIQVKALADLRASILGLGVAHDAATNGNKATALVAIDQISARAEETKRLYDAFAKPNS